MQKKFKNRKNSKEARQSELQSAVHNEISSQSSSEEEIFLTCTYPLGMISFTDHLEHVLVL